MTDLEQRGLPGVGVASDVFVDAAKSQGEALGFSPAMVFVPHPIQDRTDVEIRKLADDAVESIVSALTTN